MRTSCSCRSATCTGRPGCDAVAYADALVECLDGISTELGAMDDLGHYGRNVMQANQHVDELRRLLVLGKVL